MEGAVRRSTIVSVRTLRVNIIANDFSTTTYKMYKINISSHYRLNYRNS